MRVRLESGWPHGYMVKAKVTESDFIGDYGKMREENRNYAVLDLKRSGLTPEDMGVDMSGAITRAEGAKAVYMIPYFRAFTGEPYRNGRGEAVMFRNRQLHPDLRYMQPSRNTYEAEGVPHLVPYTHPQIWGMDCSAMALCEGEKKSVSVLKYLGIPCIGIGGCWNWIKDSKGKRDLNPELYNIFIGKAVKTLYVITDGDVQDKDEVRRAYGDLVSCLKRRVPGMEVVVLDPRGKIDDLIVQRAESLEANGQTDDQVRVGLRQWWGEIKGMRLADGVLRNSAGMIAQECDLIMTTNKEGVESPVQNDANVRSIFRKHHYFQTADMYRNMDSGSLTWMGEQFREEADAMNIVSYFQDTLGLSKWSYDLINRGIYAQMEEQARSPFKTWLETRQWDGRERLSDWAIRLWGCEDTEENREICRKLFLSSVGMIMNPGSMIRWMLILKGPQSTGKTGFPRAMFDDNEGRTGRVKVLTGVKDDKDLLISASSCLVLMFDEWRLATNADINFMKSFVTQNVFSFRAMYGRGDGNRPRRCILMGSTNKSEFLEKDVTGQSRYAILEVPRRLDFKAFYAEREQLWAEAVQAWKDEEFWSELKERDVSRYEIENPIFTQLRDDIEELLNGKFGGKMGSVWEPTEYNGYWYIHPNWLMEKLGFKPGDAQWVNTRGPRAQIKDWLLKQMGADYVNVSKFKDKLSVKASFMYRLRARQ